MVRSQAAFHRAIRTLAWVAVSAVVLAGCGTAAAGGSAAHFQGTATFALQPGTAPNWILPFEPPAYEFAPNEFEFANLMWPSLYRFGLHNQLGVNYGVSMARPPIFSDGGRTVTITLRHYRWSDGAPVTSADVKFWMQIVRAERANWGFYVPGEFPDNVTRMAFPSRYTFSLTFNRAYNRNWLIGNELSLISPIPQHAWDRTSAHAPVGNDAATTAGARAVYQFLSYQSQQLSTYGSNPLWRVVDGPFVIDSYVPVTGEAVLRANPSYSGPDQPHVAFIREVPFTSDQAEFDTLRAGGLDYGYLPSQDLALRTYFRSKGYTLAPWVSWSITYIDINFRNPQVGPMFRQLYVRQAIQSLVDQPGIIRHILAGYGYPTYGPVPTQPVSALLSRVERHWIYPYDPAHARALLAAHGWAIHQGGTTTCARPGTGPGECGAGIRAGAGLSFQLRYGGGFISMTQEMEVLKSDMSQAGIQLGVQSAPESTVYGDVAPCHRATGQNCSWQMLDYGTPGGSWIFGDYPSGELLFATGAAANGGAYSSPATDAAINATHLESGLAPMYRYEANVAKQLPVIWFPTADYALSEIAPTLHGVIPQNPLQFVDPQDWSLSG